MDQVLEQLSMELAGSENGRPLWQAIVDAPFEHKLEIGRLHLGIIVLCLADLDSGHINRVALSNTEPAAGTKQMSVKRFEDITIPLAHEENILSLAIRDGVPHMATDWKYLFTPALTDQEARFNQAGGGIGCSYVYPLTGPAGGGALIFSYYQYPDKIGDEQRRFMSEYSRLAGARLATAKSRS